MSIKDLIPVNRNKKESEHPIAYDSPFMSIQNEMNRMFNHLFNDFGRMSMHETMDVSFPKLSVKDNGKNLLIDAELPGVDKKDVEISIHDNVLSIRGEKRQEQEDKNDKYYYMEQSYGSFHRQIPLQCDIHEDQITAKFKNGVLKITVPKCEVQSAKKIEVQID